jgi:hypothetical protein
MAAPQPARVSEARLARRTRTIKVAFCSMMTRIYFREGQDLYKLSAPREAINGHLAGVRFGQAVRTCPGAGADWVPPSTDQRLIGNCYILPPVWSAGLGTSSFLRVSERNSIYARGSRG